MPTLLGLAPRSQTAAYFRCERSSVDCLDAILYIIAMNVDRRLTVIFTLRNHGTLIRVISARDMHRKEEPYMTKRLKEPPLFRSEAAERKFWATHDTTPHFDTAKSVRAALPNLHPSTQTISLRLPKHLLDRIKSQAKAKAKDVPYFLPIPESRPRIDLALGHRNDAIRPFPVTGNAWKRPLARHSFLH